ncbi:sensor histidine kinase [Actinophytocola gossypii]|uniref:Sensor histidine kinase n=1 Tax=Actinophytocola gossypii TaxID=2812003 RepID=A0ABT2JBG2_9PSEU|nr:histidine kinase [Actinophytocola gossypii]MCT2585106.1 sensor histidine kinase [Actinophytocola gossypii]
MTEHRRTYRSAACGDTARGRLRTLNIVTQVSALAPVGTLLVVIDATNWWQAAVLALGVLTALVAVVRWAADDLARVAVPCLVVSMAVWVFGVLTEGHTAFYGISVVACLIVPALPRHRGAAAVGMTALVAAVGATRLSLSDDVPGVLVTYVLIPTGVIVVTIGFMFANQAFYRVLDELDEAREREAELAVVQERARFASDLHDIQGHTLHVVKLKVALAERLVRTDADRAAEELREIHALVGDTIKQTKELAYAQRRLNLSAELENAKNLFEAAGIRVRVERESDVDPHANELLGQVLRETTTNILRHAQATEVLITLSRSGIAIDNDGAPEAPLDELRGLATLRERVAGDGGELTVEQQGGRFLTAAAFPGGQWREDP